MKKTLMWFKWKNPFKVLHDEDINENGDYKDSYEKSKLKQYHGPVIVGPMGIIPVTEANSPDKVFNFWMGHTNFSITKEVADRIEKINGVETLDINTRYRFRVGIGKAFNEDKVKDAIRYRLCRAKKAKQTTHENMLCDHMNKKYKYWVVFELADGTVSPKGSDNKEEIEVEINKNKDLKKITSWEYKC